MGFRGIKLGISPIGWTNDDMPELGGDITFERCISETALAGFAGCEIGGKFPSDADELTFSLNVRNLQVANRWYSAYLLTKPFEDVERDFRGNCEFLQKLGADKIGVSEQSYSIQGKPVPIFGGTRHTMDAKEWSVLCGGLNRLGEISLEYGVDLTYHHHAGTVVQTAEETDILLENTDESKVSLLYDSGHFAYCGEDPAAVLRRYADRIKHVHLKDVRTAVVERVKRENLSFLDGVKAGTFTVPGDGDIDFRPILDFIKRAGYNGWLIVEAEQDPEKANPFEYAVKARNYIKKVAGI